MFDKAKAIINLPEVFEKGKMVSNPAAWKRGDITAKFLFGFLATLVGMARIFGYELPLTDEQLGAIATSVMAVYGMFIGPAITVATTEKLGAKPKE